ncbi:hypothetical protein NDU88_001793 [Pleurodeles waltl]|uniref:Uncharacterized protein n=1 Tax=Pleurodeles waltl TaxID=8319 RepID=A0AAV7WMU3_PLEWA|nr:hypothetical protein NDU88_001793 [Pleurodeles waltl]
MVYNSLELRAWPRWRPERQHKLQLRSLARINILQASPIKLPEDHTGGRGCVSAAATAQQTASVWPGCWICAHGCGLHARCVCSVAPSATRNWSSGPQQAQRTSCGFSGLTRGAGFERRPAADILGQRHRTRLSRRGAAPYKLRPAGAGLQLY